MTTTIGFFVSYEQFAVFVGALSQPFNDWTDPHIAQGFAWRPGSVSFRTMVEEGRHVVHIEALQKFPELSDDALRVIDVPFEVPADGLVEIGSITETVPIKLPPGAAMIRCAFYPPAREGEELVRLSFAAGEQPRFCVVRADEHLAPVGELLTCAKPATN